jgi:hypothetical protein
MSALATRQLSRAATRQRGLDSRWRGHDGEFSTFLESGNFSQASRVVIVSEAKNPCFDCFPGCGRTENAGRGLP